MNTATSVIGVTFSLTGALKVAQEKLGQKGLRSYFSLKRMLDIRGLRNAVLFRLFDALIGPVVSYGSQVWMPSTHALDQIILALHEPNRSTAATHSHLPKLATDHIERLHLSFLKYTSNTTFWGDTGRHPMIISLTKQILTYLGRLQKMDEDNSQALVRHALRE